jgi:hypothetical protein
VGKKGMNRQNPWVQKQRDYPGVLDVMDKKSGISQSQNLIEGHLVITRKLIDN